MGCPFYLALVTAVIFTSIPVTTSSSWNYPSSSQYHIQTDEGPERYFRYQTDSGQYRKEKRLEDGTVIGTYAWIDANGLLRQRDYIADNAGYRILKTKNVYVGRNAPVGEAVAAVRKLPANAGSLVKPLEPSKSSYLPPGEFGAKFSTPQVQVSPNAYPSSTVAPVSTTALPPYASTPVVPQTPSTVFIGSTTPRPFESSTSSDFVSTTKYTEETFRTSSSPFEIYVPPSPSTLPPPINSNSLDLYSGNPQYEHYKEPFNPYVFQNGPTYPIDRNGQTFTGYRNNIGNGYDPQYQHYDGVSVTNDGFRYYIPRAYHEEQSLPGNVKSGSFGYIDPFGIRRVIYYNASPDGGFKHRKNNRYVGFDATPYDPRPQ